MRALRRSWSLVARRHGLLPPCSDVVPSRPQVGEGAQRRCQGTIGKKIPKLTTKEKLGWGHTSSPVRRIPVLKQSSGELYGIQAAVGADVNRLADFTATSARQLACGKATEVRR